MSLVVYRIRKKWEEGILRMLSNKYIYLMFWIFELKIRVCNSPFTWIVLYTCPV